MEEKCLTRRLTYIYEYLETVLIVFTAMILATNIINVTKVSGIAL
jgi:hypothetical protein